MKVILALMLVLALPVATTTRAATAAEQACEGTTEEMLRCHAPEVKELLRQWVYAWGEGDTEAYLSLYNSIRSPRDGMSRDAWEANRRSRVTPERKVEINLKLESMGLEDSGIFDVVFLQQYVSQNYRDEVRKRLFLIREQGDLRIWKEEVLD